MRQATLATAFRRFFSFSGTGGLSVMLRGGLFAALLPVFLSVNPPVEELRLRLLVVVYTSSFARTLTPAQLERLHEEIAEFVDFYQESAGAVLSLDLTWLQIDRRLELHEVQEISKGRYYLSRENIEAELVRRGMNGGDFDEVVCFYAWDGQNRHGAQLAYGGGAVGPDGKFLGDAGYNSIGVFAWDPGRISQIMIHEVLHNIDDMFSRSGMPDEFYSSDDMSRHIDELVRERPGAFRPEFTDEGILDLAERERKGEEGYPWKTQLVYYRWLLRRTPRDSWLRLKYGRRVTLSQQSMSLRPLYSTLIYSASNDSLYLPILLRDSLNHHIANAEVSAGTSKTPLRPARYEHTDFEGKALFENSLYGGWIKPPKRPGRIVVQARVNGKRLVSEPLASPAMTAVIDVAAEQTVLLDEEGPFQLEVALQRERFAAKGDPIGGAVLTATVGGKHLLMKEGAPGEYTTPLADLHNGPNIVSIQGGKEGWTVLPATTTIRAVMSWDLLTPAVIEAQRGMPLEIWVRAVRNEPLEDASISLELGDVDLPMETLGNGLFKARISAVPDGVDSLVLRGRLPGPEDTMGPVLRKTLPLRAIYRGQIVAGDELRGAAGRPIPIVAQVRNRMGDILIGYSVPLVAIVGSQVLPLLAEDADGRYVGKLELPPGHYRAKIVALDGKVGVKNFRIRVER